MFIAWAAVGVWDTVVAQLLPRSLAESAPTVYEAIIAMTGFLPWWAWIIIGLIILLIVIIEYSVKRGKGHVNYRETDRNQAIGTYGLTDVDYDKEVSQIRRDILWLKDKATDHMPYSAYENEMLERYWRVRNSDHLIWSNDEISELRELFLNRIMNIIHFQKTYSSDEHRDATQQGVLKYWRKLDEKLNTATNDKNQ